MANNLVECQRTNRERKQCIWRGVGTEGSILVGNVASRPQILEAAIHHMQRIKYVGEYVQDVLSKARLEIESQDHLLKIGKKEGAASEMAEIQKVKETWQEFYNTLKGATKSE